MPFVCWLFVLVLEWSMWTCLEKVESFPDLKGELDEEPEKFYARI
jgi:hypothetical protein